MIDLPDIRKQTKTLLICSLVCLNALFIVYWVTLSMNYCLHYDDVHFMWKLREYSIFEYVREMYMTRGGNFVGYGINGIIFKISNWIGDYHIWPLLFYLMGVTMSYASIRGKIKGVGNWGILLGVTALYNVYILTVPDYAVFTWLCAMSYFLYGPAMCLFLRLLNEKELTAWEWCLTAIIALFLSGSNVTITPMVWAFMIVNALWILANNKWDLKVSWKNITIRRIVFLAIGMICAYAIMFIAPGNFSRLENGSDMEHPSNIVQMIGAWINCIVIFLYMMSFYLPYHLLAAGLGYLVGSRSEVEIQNKRRLIITVIIAFTIYLGIAVIPLAYLSNGFGIQRNYTHITFFYILMWLAIGYVLGAKKKCSRKGYLFSTLFSLFLIVIMAINIQIDVPKVKAYHKAHTEREAKLVELQKTGNLETIEVKKYPSTATLDAKCVVLELIGNKTSHQTIYYESDTSVEPNEYEGHIKHLLGLDFDFVLSQKKD